MTSEPTPGTWIARGRLLGVVVLTGVAAGAGGIVLTLLLHLVQHLAYGYSEQSFLLGVEHASPLRRVLAPAAGGAAVGTAWLLIRRNGRQLRPVVDALESPKPPARPLLSSLDACVQIAAVGFGASLGREGAARQVGAAVGAWLAERAKLSIDQQRTVLACGAGAGLAAVYDVPLSGALFAVEVLLRSRRLRHLVPAGLSSAAATVIALTVLPNRPTYDASSLHLTAGAVVFALLIGPLAAGTGVLFLRLMAAARQRNANGWRLPAATTLAFAAVGALAIGYPELPGNGRGLTQLALTSAPPLLVLAALLVLKPLVTAACLASGASGGLLTPALATGAALGALTGRLWDLMWPGTPLGVFALLAATAVLSVTQRAPLTALALGLELSHADVFLLLPMILAITMAFVAGRSRPWSARALT